MINLDESFSIDTPTFQLVHRKVNSSSLPLTIAIKNNSLTLSKFSNLFKDMNQTNDYQTIMLKVNN
jgi:hypothetical protein